MQRCDSRLAGFHRLAHLGGKSCGSRHFSFSSAYWVRGRSKGGRNTRRIDEDESHPAFLPASKLPRVAERQQPEAWISLLNPVLPARLRTGLHNHGKDGKDEAASEDEETRLTPRDVALILQRARRSHGLDLLTYLGVDKGRWKAVTWLLTRIVDNLWEGNSDAVSSKKQSILPGPWKSQKTLHQITENDEHGIQLEPSSDLLPLRPLDELTSEASPLYRPLEATVNHEILGVIWTSLGNMIIADAAREDRPEKTITPQILEIIALLHHSGMMPSSIYSYQPSDDLNALRQPPTLHLLSSHILTSLTDAAWRAHESLIVEEAKSRGGEYLAMRPELPGSMYKVHVAGLGHEVWLELVLWSCLYGKWIEEGASILQNAIRDGAWSALSWRELAGPLIQRGQEKSINWDDLTYRLNAGQIYGDPTLTKSTKDKVKRTLSTEVVAAFVDALLDVIRTSVGTRGTPAATALQSINEFKSFLDGNSLSLGSTSWDIVVFRFFDSQGVDIEQDPNLAFRIVRLLSSEFGEELSATNAPARNEDWQPLPAYVLDGTAISVGLMHRILQAYIKTGNLAGALRTFEELQRMTDANKQKSIKNFFNRQALEAVEPTEDDGEVNDGEVNFESRYAGIEYPGFYPQLPATILAPFLDMVTETKSFEFGKWLLHSEDVDGPIIPDRLYADPLVGPALVRFASATEDVVLLSTLLAKQGEGEEEGSKIPQGTMLALLQGQVHLRKWDTVDRILDWVREAPGYPLQGETVATLAHAVLREIDPVRGPEWDSKAQQDLHRAFAMLFRISLDARRLNQDLFYRVRTTLLVLGCIDTQWEHFVWSLREHTFGSQRYSMTSSSFNIVLDGVVSKYGSEKAKAFLGKFWRAAVDDSITAPMDRPETEHAGVPRMPIERPDAYVRSSPLDISISLGQDGRGRRPARLHGKFTPSINTVNIILRRALDEHQDNPVQMQADLDWGRRLMRLLGMREPDVEQEISRVAPQMGTERQIERWKSLQS
ncbi:hypothetical protein BDV97DRAFT_356916 [Delphinella strobiligena]|nr:hypothetical protein BDV97DRAFT_356916 [Delphinella strobiligena]